MKIEIQEKNWYVKRGVEPLAYMTAYGTDSAFRKRSETGLSWAHGYRSEKVNNDPVIFDNTLRSGFKIIDNVSRWSTSNVVWRVLDPEGFEVEIYSGNMMEIVKCAEIKHGEIMTKCIWGRESGKNVLLPESSEPYQSAVEFTKKKDVKIAVKDINAGDTITLKNNVTYTYLGHYHAIFVDYIETTAASELKYSPKKYYFVEHNGKIVTFASLNVIDHIVNEPEFDDYELFVNERLQKDYIWQQHEAIFAVISDVPETITFCFTPCDYSSIITDKRYQSRAYSYLVSSDGINSYLINDQNSYGRRDEYMDSVVKIASVTPNIIQPATDVTIGWRGGRTVRHFVSQIERKNINIVKRIEAYVNGKTYRIPRFV